MHVQSCRFADLNLLLFSIPRCRRRRCCSSSLLRIHLSVAEAVENQSWHWALPSDKGIHCIGFNLHWFHIRPYHILTKVRYLLSSVRRPKELRFSQKWFCAIRSSILVHKPSAEEWQIVTPWSRWQILPMIFWQPYLCRWQKCMIAVSLW